MCDWWYKTGSLASISWALHKQIINGVSESWAPHLICNWDSVEFNSIGSRVSPRGIWKSWGDLNELLVISFTNWDHEQLAEMLIYYKCLETVNSLHGVNILHCCYVYNYSTKTNPVKVFFSPWSALWYGLFMRGIFIGAQRFLHKHIAKIEMPSMGVWVCFLSQKKREKKRKEGKTRTIDERLGSKSQNWFVTSTASQIEGATVYLAS